MDSKKCEWSPNVSKYIKHCGVKSRVVTETRWEELGVMGNLLTDGIMIWQTKLTDLGLGKKEKVRSRARKHVSPCRWWWRCDAGLGFTCQHRLRKPGLRGKKNKAPTTVLDNESWVAVKILSEWVQQWRNLKLLNKLIIGPGNACCVGWMRIEKLLTHGMYFSGWCIFSCSDFIFEHMNYEYIVLMCVISV